MGRCALAAERRYIIAKGASPWNRSEQQSLAPEGRYQARFGERLPTPPKRPTESSPIAGRPSVGSVARSETGHNSAPDHCLSPFAGLFCFFSGRTGQVNLHQERVQPGSMRFHAGKEIGTVAEVLGRPADFGQGTKPQPDLAVACVAIVVSTAINKNERKNRSSDCMASAPVE
jgi:hypothetical protein